MKQLRYGFLGYTNFVVSYNPNTDEYAMEVVEYGEATYENGFEMETHLEKFPGSIYHQYQYSDFQWTKKIPLEVKNWHRRFWGLKPVKPSKWSPASVPTHTTLSMFEMGETDATV